MKACLLFLLTVLFAGPVLAQSPMQSENVFLITLDGLRWQELFTGADPELINHGDYVENGDALSEAFWDDDFEVRRERLMPFFWNTIATRGQLYGNRSLNCKANLTNKQWFSYPGYNEILTGYDDPRITSNDKIPNPNKTVLEVVHEMDGFHGKVAAFGSWDVFPFIINEERSGIPVNAGFEPAATAGLTDRELFLNELQTQIPSPWSTVRLDAFTHHFALEHIKKTLPRFVYIAYGETDDFAHNGKYDAYLKSARQTDAFIEDLWLFVQRHGFYKDKTTFVITTDHGRGTEPLDTWRSHGTAIKGADETWIAVLGPDTPGIGEASNCEPLFTDQVAKTAARFLGVEYSNSMNVGKVIGSAFK